VMLPNLETGLWSAILQAAALQGPGKEDLEARNHALAMLRSLAAYPANRTLIRTDQRVREVLVSAVGSIEAEDHRARLHGLAALAELVSDIPKGADTAWCDEAVHSALASAEALVGPDDVEVRDHALMVLRNLAA